MTKQDWTSGLRWMRDKFAGWLASVTVFSFLWIAVGIAVAVLFVWDGVWSRHQAPSSLDPVTFQAAGWTLRIWTVFGLAAALWCFRHAAHWVGGFFVVTWIATSVMTYGHALGFMMGGQAERYASGAVAEKTLEISTQSVDDQIKELERQKAEVRADLLIAVTPLNAEIASLDSDGKLNEDLGTKQKARRDALQDKATLKIDGLDAQILALRADAKDEQINGETNVATAVKFDPLYLTLAEWTDGKPGRPDDESARAIAQKTGAFWALLIEMVGGLGVALLYSVHAHMAARKPVIDLIDGGESDDVPAGHKRVEIPTEEWDEMLDVYSKFKKRSEAAALRAKLPIEHREWMKSKKKEIADAHSGGLSAQEIYEESGFVSWPEFENFVNKVFNGRAAAKILGKAAPAETPDPRASTKTVGDFMPETETEAIEEEAPEPEEAENSETPEIDAFEPEPVEDTGNSEEEPEPEPEPKQEWGVAVYEEPANETDPDKEEAA